MTHTSYGFIRNTKNFTIISSSIKDTGQFDNPMFKTPKKIWFSYFLVHLRPFKVLGHKTVWRESTCGVKKSTSYGNQSSWPFHVGVENRIQMASGGTAGLATR